MLQAPKILALSQVADLPRVNSGRARIEREFCAEPRNLYITIDGQKSYWQLSWREPLSVPDVTPPNRSEWVRLQGNAFNCWVSLERDGWCDAIGERTWEDYNGESQQLAWCLAHESLLNHLGGLWGQRFSVPQDSSPSSQQPPHTALQNEALFCISFRVESGNHLSTGVIAVPESKIIPWLHQTSWDPAPVGSVLSPAATALPQEIDILMECPSLTSGELQEFQTGDLLLIDSLTRCWQSLYLQLLPAQDADAYCTDDLSTIKSFTGSSAPNRDRNFSNPLQASAHLQDGQLHVLSAWKPHPRYKDVKREDFMTSKQTELTAGTELIKDLPIHLSLQLGRLTLSWRELEALQPGYVFELPQPLDAAKVTLLANGHPIGRGELVAIGDSLGVRLTEFDGRGIQQS